MIRRPPRSTLFPTRRSSDLPQSPTGQITVLTQTASLQLHHYPNSRSDTLFSGKAQLDFHLARSEEHTSELQSHSDLVCRLLLEKKKQRTNITTSKSDHRYLA